MNAAELTATVTATAIALAKDKTLEEIGVLSAVFSQLGDTLATMAAVQALQNARRGAATPVVILD